MPRSPAPSQRIPTRDWLQKTLRSLGNPKAAEMARRFFKTGPGEYAEGDELLGVSMGDQRALVERCADPDDATIDALLESPTHEERMIALLFLVRAFDREPHRDLYDRYLAAAKAGRVNNWDLVDASAAQIVGRWLRTRPRAPLSRLARSRSMWERRIAIVATFDFITNGEHADTFTIAKLLLEDDQDLLHKATGWMLREVGKRVSEKLLCGFLDEHATKMPRTMLRYAIERLPTAQRATYLAARA